ncbi:MAG: DUF6508 domain-containing protein [Puia sp.]
MIKLADFPKHIDSLKNEDWLKLFKLLDEINASKDFGQFKKLEILPDGSSQFPHYNWSHVVIRFVDVVYELGIIVTFDWPDWAAGKAMLANPNTRYEGLGVVTLCKLLTVIVRSDRFIDGTLVGCFEAGIMQKIILGLKKGIAQ